MSTSPEEGMASLYRNLETAAGKSIHEWVTIARATGFAKHKALVDHIKQQHGLTHGYAHQIALRALAAPDAPTESADLLAQQYSGAKAAMKPIYDIIAAEIAAFGTDIEFSRKKADVSVRRSKQFAIIQPAAARIDVGLVLKDAFVTPRLEVAGSFNAMVTHRVRVASENDIDAALITWLHAAYDAA